MLCPASALLIYTVLVIHTSKFHVTCILLHDKWANSHSVYMYCLDIYSDSDLFSRFWCFVNKAGISHKLDHLTISNLAASQMYIDVMYSNAL